MTRAFDPALLSLVDNCMLGDDEAEPDEFQVIDTCPDCGEVIELDDGEMFNRDGTPHACIEEEVPA